MLKEEKLDWISEETRLSGKWTREYVKFLGDSRDRGGFQGKFRWGSKATNSPMWEMLLSAIKGCPDRESLHFIAVGHIEKIELLFLSFYPSFLFDNFIFSFKKSTIEKWINMEKKKCFQSYCFRNSFLMVD